MEVPVFLFLVRHGEALPADTGDSARALSPKGVAEAEMVASHLHKIGVSVQAIVHSTKARAAQTAGILGRCIDPPNGLAESGELGPLADPSLIAAKLEDIQIDLMLVGHMPYMSRLASLLVSGYADDSAFIFDTCSVACLRRDSGIWSLVWFISPSLIQEEQQI
jgi:phosphohistidine phosphatase